MDIKKLLEIRKKIKAKKPNFVRQDYHKKARLKKKWRRPKGLQSKLRLHFRGKVKPVSPGYRSPKKVSGLDKNGLQIKLISSIKELGGLDPKKQAIIVSSSIGERKRILILKKAKEAGINVLNIDIGQRIKKTEDKINAKKKENEEKKKIVKEKGVKKEKLADKIEDTEGKKEAEKKEKNKVLTKRER